MNSKKIVVAALYHFVDIKVVYAELRTPILDCCVAHDIKGTLLLAHEGINGTVAGSRVGIDALLALLKSMPEFAALAHKESYTDVQPFCRTKVKLKQEIVTIGLPEVSPTKISGKYVAPEDWNALISDPEVLVLDTRNDYEVKIGSFKNAVDPKTTTFREFPAYVEANLDKNKHKKVAMFCTGGIRCEKASSYMLDRGFAEVYHLKGGILKYIEAVPEKESLWQGECFVFDERVAVDHNLNPGSYDQCYGCRHPLTVAEQQSEHYAPGISCPKCYDSLTAAQKARFAERHKQINLATARGEQHIG